MVEIDLNENDQKLLAFCLNRRKSISEIARGIGIAPKNVSVRIERLKKAKKIRVETGMNRSKKYIRTIAGDKTISYFLELLKEIKRRGGQISKEEFFSFYSFEKTENQDKFDAPFKLFFTEGKLVEELIRITPAGKKFLKDNSK